jgi:hypothetical protein
MFWINRKKIASLFSLICLSSCLFNVCSSKPSLAQTITKKKYKEIKVKPIETSIGTKQLTNRVGQFLVVYQPSSNLNHQKLQNAMRKAGLFENLVQGLNSLNLVMRVDVPVVLTDCGSVNAYYTSSDHSITICHEFIIGAAEDFNKHLKLPSQESFEKGLYATIFAFFHELGHALIDTLPLPAVGQEEDAVDEFAAIMILQSGGDETANIVVNGAIWFGLQPKGPFWDEHPPSDKRLFNLLCLVYGSNPQKYGPAFAGLFKNQRVTREELQTRAARCQQEYDKKLASWNQLLLPHFAVQNRPWGRVNSSYTHPYPAPPNNSRGRIW